MLENYYSRLSEVYKEKFNSKPTIPYYEKFDKDMITSENEVIEKMAALF